MARSHQEITRRTGLPKATVSRLAFTLVESGFLRHNVGKGEYGLGAGGLTLGFKVLSNTDIVQIAQPVLEQLALETQAAVSIGLRHELSMVYIGHARGQGLLTLGLDVGARVPIDTTAMGRALICAMQPFQRQIVYGQIEARSRIAWPTTRVALDAAIDHYRRHGFVASQGEWQTGISAVGAALDLGDGREPYALNIGGPSDRLDPECLTEDFGPRLALASRRICDLVVSGGDAFRRP